MAKLSIVAGATSQSVNIFIQDSSSTVGAGLSGLVFNSSGLIAYYTFTGVNATSTQITLATLSAVNSAYSSGGFKEIDATNMKGLYRLDLPNAVLATSKGRAVTVQLGGATNMAPCVLEIELTGWDNQDGVHGGMTALPNTACTTNASLITSGTGTDQFQVASGIGSADVNKWTGTTVATPITAGIPVVDWTPSPAELTGTATASASNTITLASTASTTANFYSGMMILITSGTGKGQARIITGYTTGRVATVTPAWTTTPASTATYIIYPIGQADLEVILAANSSSGAAVTAATAGILDVNTKNYNNVAAQTDGNNLPKVDVEDWKAGVVPAVNVTGVPKVDVVDILGTASAGTAGYVGVDWSHINAPTTTVDLSNTTIKNLDNNPPGYPTNFNLLSIDGSGRVDVGKILGTAQTGADVGEMAKAMIIDSGTAQSGGASTIQLRAGAPNLGTAPRDLYVVITGNTGVTQVRAISSFNNSTKTVTVYTAWATNPDATSTYAIYADSNIANDNQAFPPNFASLGIDSGGNIAIVNEVVALDTNLDKTGYSLASGQLFIKKNVALNNFQFVLTDSTTHAPKTGVTVTATRDIDGGGFAACANAVTEIANGWYTINLAASDLNGTVISLRFTGAGTDDRNITIITQS